MKSIALLHTHLFSNIEITNDADQLIEKLFQEHYDLALVDFIYFEEIREVRDFYEGTLFFIDRSYNPLHLKRALQVADYYFLYGEKERIWWQMEYIRNKVIGGRIFRYKDLFFDRQKRRLFKNSIEQPLTLAEANLILGLSRGDILTYEEVIDEGIVTSKESLKVIITRLRKIGFNVISIQNIGYQLHKEST